MNVRIRAAGLYSKEPKFLSVEFTRILSQDFLSQDSVQLKVELLKYFHRTRFSIVLCFSVHKLYA